MNNKLFLIDGMALIYRAYYAMIKNPLTSSSGLNTSAIYGFINSLLKLLKDENPKYIAVVLDTKAKTFRHKQYNLYKANRKPMPDELSEQLLPLYSILESLNMKIYKKDGYEADDIIGTITKRVLEKDLTTYMYSADKDLMQLINSNTYLYTPGNSFKPIKIYKDEDVFVKCGVGATQFIDYLALLGDTSDNIPGVRGVGNKTASKLINKFSSVENIYKLINQIENPRLKNILLENQENAFLSKELVTIDVDVEIEINLEEMNSKNLTLKAMLDKLHDFDIYAFDKILENKSKPISNSNKVIKKNYQVIQTDKEFNKLLNNLAKQDIISIDLESTNINPNIANIVGISFSYKKNSGFYIPFTYLGSKVTDSIFKNRLASLKVFLQSDDIKFIGQNIKYDALILKRYDIELNNIYFDTMIAESLIAPEKNTYKLDLLSKDYLNYNMMPIEELIGEKNNQISMYDVPLDKISFYACEDADIALQIYNIQKQILIDKKLDYLFYNVEIPLINVLVNIEFNGVFIDLDIINNLCINLKKSLEILSNKIYDASNRKFNINSPKQLSEVLFDELELKMFKKRSTSVEVLKKLLNHHPIAELILEYRHLNKLVNTYLEKLPKHINSHTNRIHTSFNQAIASTGRLSSTQPNFQNIPIKTDIGKSIRKAFKSNSNDNLIISFDYSQIELRILAHYSNEKRLIEAFANNIDIHTRTAALIYGISNKDVNYNHRRVAKIINYSIAYGAGPFRISEELKISIKEASSIINNYFERYPGIKKYIDDTLAFGLENGYVKTLLGRRRNTINLQSSNRNIREAEKRATINMPIQGTASELIKIAMININKEIIKKEFKSKMILQIHDELLFESPLEERDDLIELVIKIMENSMKFKVPIKVDCNYGINWYEAH